MTISTVSTYLFTSAHSSSKEKGLIARGTALSYSLSKAAGEGLLQENLDLIKKASNIIKAPDVILAQVYSDIWEAVDAYPFDGLKKSPHPDAVSHFKIDSSPLSIRVENGYDFYYPMFFRATDDSRPVSIGFVRILLSFSTIKSELRNIIFTNILLSVIITLLAILLINVLVRRLVIKPIMRLHKSASVFRSGTLPDAVPVDSNDEIGDLSIEFNKMSQAINERTEKIVESEKRIKALFERVEHAIFGLDKEGNIIEANSKFIELFGPVKSLCVLLMSEQKGGECLLNAVSDKVVQAEERAMDKRGNEITVLLTIYPDIDEKGNVEGYDGYIIDITEKKRLEERLLRSQKLEAVGTLAGGIAHDFNNLLTAIIGYSEILLDKLEEEDPLRRHASIIYSAAERGAELTKRILSLTRKEKVEMKAVDLNEVIRGSLELLHRSIPKSIEIVRNLREDLPKIKAEPAQIQQVILNLVVNARDAMADNGRLTIETDLERVNDGMVKPIFPDRDAFVKLSISDTGTGIDKGTQSKVFDPFFTTKDTGKGTGLGLYMVHSIVTNHGGYINLYSEPGKGTRFTIYLPIARGAENEEIQEARDIGGSEVILIIDDEAYVREICRDVLAPLGYEVLLAESGSEGIRLFGQMKDKIDLVLLDMIMPKMGGNEVFAALRAMKSDTKILLCSGYSSNGFAGIDLLLKSGAKGFIQKPFSRQNIALSIRKALSQV